MNPKSPLFITIVLLFSLVLGVFLFNKGVSKNISSTNNSSSVAVKKTLQEPSTKENSAKKQYESNTMKNEGLENKQNVLSSPPIVEYTPKVLEDSLKSGKRVVLFFSADWCPSCRQAEKDFNENYSQLPADVLLVKADYDKEKDLKKQYGVTYQDTFVQLDKQGKKLVMWNSGGAGVKALNQYLR